MTHYQVNTVLTDLRIENIISLHSQRDNKNSCKESFGREAVKQHGEWEGDALNLHLPRLLIAARMAALLSKLSHATTIIILFGNTNKNVTDNFSYNVLACIAGRIIIILPAMQARTLYEKLSVTFLFAFSNKNPLGFKQF